MMIEIVSKWGANYLVADEAILVDPKALRCRSGVVIVPGDPIERIGSKRRSCFELNDGLYMVYDGLIAHEGITYALFSVPDWAGMNNPLELPLFPGSPIAYFYAFAVIVTEGLVDCFLIFNMVGNGSADISPDEVVFHRYVSYRCARCRAIHNAKTSLGGYMCTMPCDYRTSGVCGGEVIRI